MKNAIPALLLLLALSSPVAGAAASGPALSLPTLSDKQIADYKVATTAASDAISAERPDRAIREFKKAVAIHGTNDGTWYNFACVLALSGKPDEALDALRHASAAGWRDATWPAKDSDLASLHALPAFTAWLTTLGSAGDAAALELGPPAADPAALTAQLEAANAAIDRVRPVLGSTELMREARRVSEWRVASWDAIAATREGEPRAEARMEALRALTRKDYWPKSPELAEQVERRATAFVEENPAAPSAQIAELMASLAETQRLTAEAAKQAAASATEGETPEAAEARQAEQEAALADAESGLQRRLLMLAATNDDGPAVRAALAKLLAEAGDSPAERALHARLKRLVPDDAARRDLVMAEARGSWFRLEGLPAFEAKTLDGSAVTLASLKGRVVLLDFWATWCGPCKAELPNVKEAYSRFKGDGFEILGISLDKSKDGDAAAFVKWCQDNGVTWPQVFDGKHWESALAKTFGVRSIPFPLLLGRDGQVVAADEQLRGESLIESIESALLAPDARGVSGQ